MQDSYRSDIQTIKSLRGNISGFVKKDESDVAAQLIFSDGTHHLKVNQTIDLNTDDHSFKFISDDSKVRISIVASGHRNSVTVNEKSILRYSEAKVFSFWSEEWSASEIFCRSYYFTNDKLIYDLCGHPSLKLTVKDFLISLRHCDEFLVIENETAMSYEQFSEVEYKILVAMGFVSGKFIQNQSYTFSRTTKDEENDSTYKYEQLRNGSSSIYHAVTCNPYGYTNMLGRELADKLYKDKVLKCLDAQTLSKLSVLVFDSQQMQYALVLFNDANGNGLSLLVKNNCFFVVIEVLIKHFEEAFRDRLPKNYSQKGNVEKFKLLFGFLFPVTEDDVKSYSYRNKFFHGDIEKLDGKEMLAIMQKQISLIHKIVLTYIEFDGYIIDHYALRNNLPDKAFIKLN